MKRLMAICTIVVGALVMMASPSWAHKAAVVGVTDCVDGVHVVTWTISNSQFAGPMSVDATVEGYEVNVETNPVPRDSSTQATTTVPGDVTGSVTIHVVGTWPDEFTDTVEATVDLPEPCSTTTTTSPPTTVPPTTTPPEETTTTEGSSTSVVPPTTPPEECGPNTMPCTGNDPLPLVAGGLGAVVIGSGLLALRKKRSA